MDAFELLRRDHDKARMLLDQLRTDDGEARARLVRQLGDELRVYEQIEAFCFLPLFHKNGQAVDRARDAQRDHEAIRGLLGELERGPAGADGWRATVDRLSRAVERHTHVVEDDLFPVARRLLDDEGLAEMTRSMQSQRQTKFARRKGAEAAIAGRRDPQDIADARR